MADAGTLSDDDLMNPPHSMRIVVPFLPPTSNKIYVTDWRRKRIFKSRAAAAFADKFSQTVVPLYLPFISQMVGFGQDPTVAYDVYTYFYFPRWDMENKGWFQEPRKAKTRYKKMDLGNRTKLIHDCLSKALVVDDSHFFGLSEMKLVAETYGIPPQVQLVIIRSDPAKYGIPAT